MEYENQGIPDSYIWRDTKIQKEKIEGFDTLYQQITWINKCTYQVYTLNPSDSIVFETKIIEVDHDQYSFEAYPLGDKNDSIEGVARLIKN